MDPRRSTDSHEVAGPGMFVASDLNLNEPEQWWATPESVPPAIQRRAGRDLSFEVDESYHSRRGRGVVTRSIYVLYYDYSQTVIKLSFERENPARVKFEQTHSAPPTGVRKDQLEGWYERYGRAAAKIAGDSLNAASIVGDGTSFAFVSGVVEKLGDALPCVGNRAFGALVYSNLANASVAQTDEIRAGDIITFKNARFQGHKGSLRQKYAVDVGVGSDVVSGIVSEWDGTKRKIRVTAQMSAKEGGKGKGVRSESYRLGDLKSGEVIVWRIVGREYVGWDDDSL